MGRCCLPSWRKDSLLPLLCDAWVCRRRWPNTFTAMELRMRPSAVVRQGAVAHDAGRVNEARPSQGFSLKEFVHDEAFSGVLLLLCALGALVWSNSAWGETYDSVWSTELTL